MLLEEETTALWEAYDRFGRSAWESSKAEGFLEESSPDGGGHEKLSQFWTRVTSNTNSFVERIATDDNHVETAPASPTVETVVSIPQLSNITADTKDPAAMTEAQLRSELVNLWEKYNELVSFSVNLTAKRDLLNNTLEQTKRELNKYYGFLSRLSLEQLEKLQNEIQNAETNLRNEGIRIVTRHFRNYKFISNELIILHDRDCLKRGQRSLMKTLEGHAGGVTCLQVLPNGEMASGSFDRTIRIWNLEQEKCIETMEGHNDSINCLLLLPSGKLASGSDDRTIKIWKIKRGVIQTLEGHARGVTCLQLLSTGELVSGSIDCSIKIWDMESGNCKKTLEGHTNRVMGLQVLPNGQLASASRDRTIKVWHVQSGNCVKTLAGHTAWIYCLLVLPSGELVSGSGDRTIKIWNLGCGNCVKTLAGHLDIVSCLQVLPTGELISGSDDRTLKIWDLETGRCITTLEGHSAWIYCLQVLPNGDFVSGSGDRTFRVWHFPNCQNLPSVFGAFHYWIRAGPVEPTPIIVPLYYRAPSEGKVPLANDLVHLLLLLSLCLLWVL